MLSTKYHRLGSHSFCQSHTLHTRQQQSYNYTISLAIQHESSALVEESLEVRTLELLDGVSEVQHLGVELPNERL